MKLIYLCARSLAKLIFLTAYGLKVYGLEHFFRGAAIIAPNHTSYYDPPLIGAAWPEETFFLARKSLFNKFFLGFLIRNLNAYPVTGTAGDLSSIKLICNLLKEDKKVVIFPEGIRSFNGQMTTIKSGIGMLAMKCECPIIPVYIDGCYEAWNRSRRFPRMWGNIACVFGSPISSTRFLQLDKKTAQEEMAKEVKRSIEALKTWYKNGAKGTPP